LFDLALGLTASMEGEKAPAHKAASRLRLADVGGHKSDVLGVVSTGVVSMSSAPLAGLALATDGRGETSTSACGSMSAASASQESAVT